MVTVRQTVSVHRPRYTACWLPYIRLVPAVQGALGGAMHRSFLHGQWLKRIWASIPSLRHRLLPVACSERDGRHVSSARMRKPPAELD